MGSNPEIIFFIYIFFSFLDTRRLGWLEMNATWKLEMKMAVSRRLYQESPSYYIWQYFTVSHSSDAKKGGAKNAVCKFCDKTFSGCCTSRAAAHILGRPVLGQTKAGIQHV